MPNDKPAILLAEDDLNLGTLLIELLVPEGYSITHCRDGEEALKAFSKDRFDICLLDVMMPKMDGFSLAKTIRNADQNIPILFITARSMKTDKLKGYGMGADDYITKPFDEDELLWKINALTRRLTPENNIIRLGQYTFDRNNQSLTISNEVRRMTEKECRILDYLSRHRNKVIKRENMLKELWGENDYFLGRSLDVFITKIRKYLSGDPRITIDNVFGVGFILNVPDN